MRVETHNTTTGTPLKKWCLVGAGVAAPITLFLILAEIICRLLNLGFPPPVPNSQIYDPDALIGCRLKPNWRGIYTGVEVQTNSLGLRGPEIGEKLPGRPRVVLSGDSFVFGYGLRQNETLGAWLEKETGGRVETVNGGVPGYSLIQDVSWCLHLGRKMEPDYLILVSVGNDLEDPRFYPGRASTAKPPRNWVEYIQGDPRVLNLPGASSFRLVSLFQRLLKIVLPSQRSLNSDYFEFYNNFLFETSNWKEAKLALERLKDAASKDGIPLALVLYPVPVNFKNYPFKRLHGRMAEACKEIGVHVLDPTGSWKDIPAQSLRWHPDDLHPNGEANRRMADFLLTHWEPLRAAIANVNEKEQAGRR